MKKSRRLIHQSRNFIKVILTILNGKGKNVVWFLPRLPWPTRNRILPLYRAITRLWPSLSARWLENNETQSIQTHACSFADTNIDVDHFLWTGDIASDEVSQYELSEESLEAGDGFSLVTQKIYPSLPVIRPSSVLVTKCVKYHASYQICQHFNVRDGTVYTTVIQPTPVFVPFGTSTTLAYPGDQEGSGAYVPGAFPTFDPPASHSQPHPYYESDRSDGQGYPYINGYYDMPEPQFLIRTVLKNDTDLLKRSVDLQAFKVLMEDRLTRTYRQAYHQEYIPARNRRDVFYTGDYLNEYFHDSIQSCITCCRFHQACSPWEGDQSHAWQGQCPSEDSQYQVSTKYGFQGHVNNPGLS